MYDRPLLQCRTKRSVEAVLEIHFAPPLDDMREQVAVERGVLGEQGLEVERPFGGDQLVKPDLAGRQI